MNHKSGRRDRHKWLAESVDPPAAEAQGSQQSDDQPGTNSNAARCRNDDNRIKNVISHPEAALDILPRRRTRSQPGKQRPLPVRSASAQPHHLYTPPPGSLLEPRAARGSGIQHDSSRDGAHVPSPQPKAARFAPSESSSRPTGTLSRRFREIVHNLAQQMSMTPLSSTTGTGTSESAMTTTTPSDLEAGTVTTGNSTDGMLDRERDRDHRERSKRAEGSAGGSTVPSYSFSTQDLGSTGRFERRRRKKRSTSTATEEDPPGPMSYVVVDNDFDSFVPLQERTDEKHTGDGDNHDDNHSERSIMDCDIDSQYTSYHNSDSSSRRRMKRPWTLARLLEMWNYHIWLPLCHFIHSSFPDPKVEKAFKKEEWYANKHAALIAAIFLVIQWMITIAVQVELDLWRNYAYIGICGFCTLPLPLLVAFDGPRRFKWVYGFWVAAACWCWGWILTVEMYTCNFYGIDNQCGSRNFLHLLAALFGNASFAIMALGQNRGIHMTLATSWFVAAAALFFTQPKTPASMWRNLIVFELYHLFLTAMSFYRERSDRQLFSLRVQLKDQYRAVQNAQVQERRAEKTKKSFMSYIFHEVRVPLNTARLALANLDGEGAFHGMSTDQKDLIVGLDGSLRMMEKVLNDVLSFNRMESGKLIQARQPFNIHQAVHYVALSHRATAELSGLSLVLELDTRIDEIGGTVIGDEMRFKQVCSNLVSNAFKFTDSGGVKVVTKLLLPVLPQPSPESANSAQHTDRSGSAEHDIVVTPEATTVGPMETLGALTPLCLDEEKAIGLVEPDNHGATVLLSQLPTDPVSAKSVASFGSKHISLDETARVSFDFADPDRPSIEVGTSAVTRRLSDTSIAPRSRRMSRSPTGNAFPPAPTPQRTDQTPRKALIRVEVHDTGVGISLSDVRDNRLFSPYVQTEIGRRQGGKGSGLGLALVMQIVKLSKGRLGVDSEVGKGSVFWFEIPYALSPKPTAPSSQPQWVPPEKRRESDPSSRGSIAIARGNGSSRPRTAPGERVRPNSISDEPSARSRGASPLSHAPSFNLLSFSSPAMPSNSAESSQPSPRSHVIDLTDDLESPTETRHWKGFGCIDGAQPEASGSSGSPTKDWVLEELKNESNIPPAVEQGPSLIIDLTQDQLSPLSNGMRSLTENPVDSSSRHHRSLLGRTPSLVPYQVPRTTQPGTLRTSQVAPVIPPSPPAPAAILPQYPSPGSEVPTVVKYTQPSASQSGPIGLGIGLGPSPSDSAPKPAPETLLVLVVDDDALTRKLMSRLLKRLGTTVQQAENGKIALDMIVAAQDTEPFDVVFLDNQMPIMSGVEVARALRAQQIPTFIVGCTGNALREDQDEYLRAGADDILTKPVSQTAIVKRLEEARRRRERRESTLDGAWGSPESHQ